MHNDLIFLLLRIMDYPYIQRRKVWGDANLLNTMALYSFLAEVAKVEGRGQVFKT